MAGSPVFTIEPNPRWVIIDNFSKLPPGAAIYTFRSLDPSTFKAAFRDAAGLNPYTQPILGFGNGTFPPIFWEFDPNNPTDTYYIQVWSAVQGSPGGAVMLWDFDGLSGGSSGGGGTTSTFSNVINLVNNGVFYRRTGTDNVAINTSSLTSLLLAPSNNAGYVNDTSNTNVTTNGPVGPDIVFAKSNTTGTDSITFSATPTAFPLGTHNLPQDITPPVFLSYTCTGAGSAETYKYVQFPISQNVQNLSNQTITISFFAQCTSGNTNATVTLRQYFGSGTSPAGSTDQFLNASSGSVALTANWQVFTYQVNVPDATGKVQGSCGTDALFLQFNFPLNAITTINIIKFKVYVGSFQQTDLGFEYESNDEIDKVINLPRTGDVKQSLNASPLLGWVLMNDGTIGNASSNSTARANVDTFPLYSLIWALGQANPTIAPIFTSGGVPTTFGSNAVADFDANNQLSLTKNLGRVMAGALPANVSQAFTNTGNVLTVTTSTTASFYTGMSVTVSGGSLPSPLIAGTVYYAIVLSSTTMSLATSTANALVGTAITLTTNASGTVSTLYVETLGSFIGEEKHLQAGNEIGIHSHGFTVPFSNQGASRGAGGSDTVTNANPFNGTTGNNASVVIPMNIIQPTVYMNTFIKL